MCDNVGRRASALTHTRAPERHQEMMMTDTPEYLTVPEAAELLRLPERTVARLLNEGKLPGIFAGTREGWRIRHGDLIGWTTNRTPSFLMLPDTQPRHASETKRTPTKRTKKTQTEEQD